jgi:hypothetical protein
MPFGLGFFATAGAGGAAGSFDLLESQVLGSNQTSITFSNLNSTYGTTYQHLQFRIVTRTLRSATDDGLQITFNASGNQAATHQVWGNGSSVSTQAFPSNEPQQVAAYSLPSANSVADTFGSVILDILDPFETTKNTNVRSFAGKVGNTSVVSLSGLTWYNTAAVTTIKFDSRNGNNGFAANSRFSLYGIKAA